MRLAGGCGSPRASLPATPSRRAFLQALSSDKVRATNLNCAVTADVRHDGSEPCVDVLFGGRDRWARREEGGQAGAAGAG